MKRKKNSNYFSLTFSSPIIGYDAEFWDYCVDETKETIINLFRNEARPKYAVHMTCNKGHDYYITPHVFFYERHCIHCIAPGEIGAVKYDPTIVEYWNDSYILDQISENSVQNYRFKCPFCKHVFMSRMVDILNRTPKCFICKDGQKPETPDNFDNTIYIHNR